MPTLIGIILGAIYVIGAAKFWTGFQRTNFNQNRLLLTVVWPIFIFNRAYRSNFMKALKG